jgi:drug/metabolite transporter (DMT)-like permease
MYAYIWLAVGCAVCFGIGNSMQKHGMAVTFPKIAPSRFLLELPRVLRSLLANWIWVVGLGFSVAGFVFQGKSIDAPGSKLSVIMPLLNISTIVTSLIGVLLLAERVQKLEWLGITALTFGAVLVCAFDRGGESHELHKGLLIVCYLIGIGSMAALVAAFTLTRSWKGAETLLAIASGFGFGMGAVALKMLDYDLKNVIGGFYVTDPHFLVTFLGSPNGWMVIVFNLVGFALFQLSFAHGRVSMVGPFSQVFAMVSPVMAGILAFRESVVVWQWLGVMVVTASIFLVGRGEPPESSSGRPPIQEK